MPMTSSSSAWLSEPALRDRRTLPRGPGQGALRPDVLTGQAGSAVPRGLEVNPGHRRVFLQARLKPGELRVAGVVHPVDNVIQIV